MNKNKIGFMQGRLSNLVNNSIQAFPRDNWREEFSIAKRIDLSLMEWTLDYEHLYENPLMKEDGRKEINFLSKVSSILIPSITGDCFMQRPFWKAKNEELNFLQKTFIDVINAASKLNIKYLILPLVDNGSIKNKNQEDILIGFLLENKSFIKNSNLNILFESDFNPKNLKSFIRKLPSDLFGINYDTGNSAAYGYNPDEEFYYYGEYIKNVHIKDRKKNGTTIPLREGDVDFKKVFTNLRKMSYQGNFILQTARDENNKHAEAISIYRDFTLNYIDRYL